MSKKPISFREQMKLARPDVVERQRRNRQKSALALKLRTLRDAIGMSQDDVAHATGMTTQLIEQMESLVGSIPDIKDLERYVDVCGGDIKAVTPSIDTDQLGNKPGSS